MTAEPTPVPAPDPPRTRWVHALAFGLLVATLGVLLRWAQLRSVVAVLHHGEFNGLGRLLWDLRTDGFEWRGFHAFWDRYQYQTYAQGTVYTQAASALFGRVLGMGTGALHATTIAGEAALLFSVGAGVARQVGLRWAAAAVGVLLLPPVLVVAWQLAPYGNHTEFLVFPVLLGLWLTGRPPEERSRATWLWPLLLIPPALVLYRGNAAGVAALAGVLLGTLRWRRALPGLLMLGAAAGATYWILAYGIGADLTGIGPEAFGAEVLPDHALAGSDRSAALRRIPEHLAAAPRWFLDGMGYRALLALGWLLAATAWVHPRGVGGLPARYASLWAAGALAVPVLAGEAYPRYLVPAWYALVFCWIAVLMDTGPHRRAVRGVAAAVLVTLAVGGGIEGRFWVRPALWSQTADFDGLALWYRLEVNNVDMDELPYYRRLLSEERGSRWVGFSTNWSPDGCRSEPLFIADPGYFPRPGREDCRGFDSAAVRGMVQQAEGELQRLDVNGAARDEALGDLGRGLWIRTNRDLREVDRSTETLYGSVRDAVRAGARDEAARWARQ